MSASVFTVGRWSLALGGDGHAPLFFGRPVRGVGAKDVKIVTAGGTHRGLAGIKDGRLSVAVTNSPPTNGRAAVKNTLAPHRRLPHRAGHLVFLSDAE
ncbi:hypothetical protein [Streptomyces sp. NPDC058664]|uniref:hypothetical protein n=1 Tax=unclassified Streptomyces TaxID=2593676 RepID=UPI00365792B9